MAAVGGLASGLGGCRESGLRAEGFTLSLSAGRYTGSGGEGSATVWPVGPETTQIQVLAAPLCHCVILDKSLPEPQFCLCE